MIPMVVTIQERGPVKRGLKREHRRSAKVSWAESGEWFARNMTDKRFTHAHARQAGYTPRKRGYEMRKLKRFGHTRPLEFSGRSRLRSRTFRVAATSNGVRLRYPRLRAFNFRNPNSAVDMRAEWEKLLPDELERVGERYELTYDREFNSNKDSATETIQ